MGYFMIPNLMSSFMFGWHIGAKNKNWYLVAIYLTLYVLGMYIEFKVFR